MIIATIANVDIERAEVFVTELKEGSWIEEVCIRIFSKIESITTNSL